MPPISPLPRDPRLTERSSFKRWLKERVRWSDTDLVGHVNNLSFSTYCETGRTEFLRDVLKRDAESRVLFLMAQTNVSFLGEVHWPGEVDIGTCILDLGRSSCRMGHGLFYREQCVGTSDELLVLIDEATRKPREIPESLRALLDEYRCPEA